MTKEDEVKGKRRGQKEEDRKGEWDELFMSCPRRGQLWPVDTR